MKAGAPSLEELESLMEDALLLADQASLSALFEEPGVIAVQVEDAELKGKSGIARLIECSGTGERSYLAEPRRVFLAGRTALLIGDNVINVARRGTDQSWRFLISVHYLDGNPLARDGEAHMHSKQRRQSMYTMVVRMSVDPIRSKEVVRHFEQNVVPWAKRQQGFVSGQWLYQPGSSEALGIVVFESDAAANTAAQDPRDYAEHESDAGRAWNIENVSVFEQVQRA